MKNSSELPRLHSFPSRQITNAEKFGRIIGETKGKGVLLFVDSHTQKGGEMYREVISAPKMQIEFAEDPIRAAEENQNEENISLFVTSAIDPKLKDNMFKPRPKGGQLLVDHSYTNDSSHESPQLFPIGITEKGLKEVLPRMEERNLIPNLVAERSRHIREVVGNDIIPYGDFRQLFHHEGVQEIRIHALGPEGTNISQVATKYIRDHNIAKKTTRIVHPAGIEPLEYAEWAREDKREGVLPLHIECAVFYGMRELYRQRCNEIVFADHHSMLLDEMQLAIRQGFQLHFSSQEKIKIAAHPSPEPLLEPWISSGIAEWVRASSNSAAAEMVAHGEADACITTESGRIRSDLEKWFSFGSPMMLFTLGTPYTQEELMPFCRERRTKGKTSSFPEIVTC